MLACYDLTSAHHSAPPRPAEGPPIATDFGWDRLNHSQKMPVKADATAALRRPTAALLIPRRGTAVARSGSVGGTRWRRRAAAAEAVQAAVELPEEYGLNHRLALAVSRGRAPWAAVR